MALSRAAAFFVYAVLLAVAVKCGMVGNLPNAILLLTGFFGQVLLFLLLKSGRLDGFLEEEKWREIRKAKEQEAAQEVATQKDGLGKPLLDGVGGARPVSERFLYLDVIKTGLVASVVVGHTCLAFANAGWIFCIQNDGVFRKGVLSLFECSEDFTMVLFFFISGYFIPNSCSKKGPKAFLIDKLLRLAPPLVVGVCVMFPLLVAFIEWHSFGKVTHPYFPMTFHLWFLLWLLVFCEMYALMSREVNTLEMKLPSMPMFLLGGFVLGVFEGIMVPLMPQSNIAGMPVGSGSLPFDVMAFSLGCVAKNNRWLHDFADRSYWWLAVVAPSWVAANFVATYFDGQDLFRDVLDKHTVDKAGTAGWINAMLLGGVAGIESVMMCMATLKLAATYFDFENKVLKLFSRATYTVYVFHPLVVVPVTMYAISMIEKWNEVTVHTTEAIVFPLVFIDVVNSFEVMDTTSFVSAWFFTVCAGSLIVWPLAILATKTPGLKNML